MWKTAQLIRENKNYDNYDFRSESDRNELINIAVAFGVTEIVIVKGNESRVTLLRLQFYCYL